MMTLEQLNKLHIEGAIGKLSDGNIKKFLLSCIDMFPEYFWTVPASNSKYHPEDERKLGGLVLHVRRLCVLTEEVVRLHELNLWERDVLLASCILHDSYARGIPPNVKQASDPFHPSYPEFMFPFNAFADRYIERRVYEEIMECVSAHSGRWSTNKLLRSNKKLPMLFHMIDYIGSRENIIVKV
jgi:hypothetical protein